MLSGQQSICPHPCLVGFYQALPSPVPSTPRHRPWAGLADVPLHGPQAQGPAMATDRGPWSNLHLGMAMDVFGQAGSGVTLLNSGAHTPKICLAGHGEQPLPHAHSRPPTATSLQSQGKPLIQRDHLGPIPAAVGSPIPVLQPQHPLGSSQPSQSRTWSELMVWFFPWDATQFSCFPPNTISPGLGGAF